MNRVSELREEVPIKTWFALWSFVGLTVASSVVMASALSCVLSAIDGTV